MKESYEVITYKNTGLHMFLVDLQYRTPHFHRDIEISAILEGELDFIYSGGRKRMCAGDFYITNPFQLHEFSGRYPARLLVLQVPISYFRNVFPQIETTEFTQAVYHHDADADLCDQAIVHLLSIGQNYFRQDPLQGLLCAAGVSQLFCDLLRQCPTRTVTEEELRRETRHGKRMRKLVEFIEAHYDGKILLSDFAEEQNLDLYYLSHSFKDYFGISFQEYVMRRRCERASELLLNTDFSLLDVSMSCGFSDPKYMKKGFTKIYGCTPKEYRRAFHVDVRDIAPEDTITSQNIMSPEVCLTLLETKYAPR